MKISKKRVGRLKMPFRYEGKSALDEVLEKIETLSLHEQERLLDLLSLKNTEKRREAIRKNARQSRRAYERGAAKEGSAKDLLQDLE